MKIPGAFPSARSLDRARKFLDELRWDKVRIGERSYTRASWRRIFWGSENEPSQGGITTWRFGAGGYFEGYLEIDSAPLEVFAALCQKYPECLLVFFFLPPDEDHVVRGEFMGTFERMKESREPELFLKWPELPESEWKSKCFPMRWIHFSLPD